MTRNSKRLVTKTEFNLIALLSIKVHYTPQINTLYQHSTTIEKWMIVTNRDYLFIDPLLIVLGVLNESLREPELDLAFSRLHRV